MAKKAAASEKKAADKKAPAGKGSATKGKKSDEEAGDKGKARAFMYMLLDSCVADVRPLLL